MARGDDGEMERHIRRLGKYCLAAKLVPRLGGEERLIWPQIAFVDEKIARLSTIKHDWTRLDTIGPGSMGSGQ